MYMKATKYIAMAAAALAFAACSNDELASVGQHPAANGMKPVEFSTALSNVTRAQIMGESDLTEYWVQAARLPLGTTRAALSRVRSTTAAHRRMPSVPTPRTAATTRAIR